MKDNYDFSKARRGALVKTAKERITIRLDPDIIQWFRDQVSGGGNYQTLINEALRAHISGASGDLEEMVERAVTRALGDKLRLVK